MRHEGQPQEQDALDNETTYDFFKSQVISRCLDPLTPSMDGNVLMEYQFELGNYLQKRYASSLISDQLDIQITYHSQALAKEKERLSIVEAKKNAMDMDNEVTIGEIIDKKLAKSVHPIMQKLETLLRKEQNEQKKSNRPTKDSYKMNGFRTPPGRDSKPTVIQTQKPKFIPKKSNFKNKTWTNEKATKTLQDDMKITQKNGRGPPHS
jgi:hypothetical protein